MVFSPSPRDRANLKRVLETAWRVLDRARDVIEQRIDSGELDRVAEQALARLPDGQANASGLSGSAPASPGSSPDR